MMFDPDEEEHLLSSLDPVDPVELRALLDHLDVERGFDLVEKIMDLPPEPVAMAWSVTAREAVARRLAGLTSTTTDPGLGRAAFAGTVLLLIVGAAVLFSIVPGQSEEEFAGSNDDDEVAIDATTTTVNVPVSEAPVLSLSAEDMSNEAATITTTPTTSTTGEEGQSPTTADATDASWSSTTPQHGVPTTVAPATNGADTSRRASATVTSRPTTTTKPTTTTRPTTTRRTTTTVRPPAPDNGPFDPRRDLLALHYDHVIYRDDAHATVAAREIAHDLGVAPVVVGGAYSASNTNYNADSEVVMDETWGPNGWYNAHTNRSGSVGNVARRWTNALSAGADVWVAEGGQSDFTADVVRRVVDDLAAVDLRDRIHVVQHSAANENKTSSQDLAYLRAAIDYIKIGDGNVSNSTANLKRFDQGFIDAALTGPFADAWARAFAYLDPIENLDFSDTVEVLHIVGVGRNDVADPGDFADYFMS